MSSFTLRTYQQRCLDELRDYFVRAREVGAKSAFDERPSRADEYRIIESWPASQQFPYVCLRVPTGGGKTLLAAHSVGIASRAFMQVDRPTVLWLAPSTTIVEQTLKVLRDRASSYRRSLDEQFKGCVSILSLSEARSVRSGTLDADCTIVVSTMQAFRVTEKEGRKVYGSNGDLIDHFANLTPTQQRLLEHVDDDGNPIAEGNAGGVIMRSLANVLRLRMPLVIVDEAHNARTGLSFETLQRFNPSAIIEFTATPAAHSRKKTGSNVLVRVSASELKAEEMIKLPIRLSRHTNPHEAITAALAKRKELERIAAESFALRGEYIRPIVLFQAETRLEGEDRLTAAKLKQVLIKDFDVRPDEIAIRTGEIDELPDDPLSSSCCLRFVITVAALREGWDCPFAYVLCSLGSLSSSGAVEQILGRILRLPYVRTKEAEELNRAYAFTTSEDLAQTSKTLEDALVESGFDSLEAKAAVETDRGEPSSGAAAAAGGSLWSEPIAEVLSKKPAQDVIDALPGPVRAHMSFVDRADTGETEIVWSGGPMARDHADALRRCLLDEDDKLSIEKIIRRSWGEGCSPSSLGVRLHLPRFAMREEEDCGGWVLFEPQGLEAHWTLDNCDAALDEQFFSTQPSRILGADIDVDAAGRVKREYFDQLEQQLGLRDLQGPVTEAGLIDWLDGEIPVREATQAEKRLYLGRLMAHLVHRRQLPLELVVSKRFRLVDAIARRIDAHRRTAQKQRFDSLLFAAKIVETRVEVAFQLPAVMRRYAPTSEYQGPVKYRNHFYENIGHMNPEEAHCAGIIDSNPSVRCWCRNLEHPSQFAFSIPLADRRFYPDFLVLLKDGRAGAVEYKGADRLDNPDTNEKKAVGRRWADLSGGRAFFEVVGNADQEAILSSLLKVAEHATAA